MSQNKSPQAATKGQEKHETGGLSLLNSYQQSAPEVKAACIFCAFFKAVPLKKGQRLVCRFLGERITPDHYCEAFVEGGGAC